MPCSSLKLTVTVQTSFKNGICARLLRSICGYFSTLLKKPVTKTALSSDKHIQNHISGFTFLRSNKAHLEQGTDQRAVDGTLVTNQFARPCKISKLCSTNSTENNAFVSYSIKRPILHEHVIYVTNFFIQSNFTMVAYLTI